MNTTLLVIQDAINALNSLPDPQQVSPQENFVQISKILFSKIAKTDEPSPEAINLLTEIIQTNLFLTIINRLNDLPAALRKQFTLIFDAAISIKQGRSYPLIIWINNNIQILDTLIGFYSNEALAITSGTILRLCAHHASLASQLLDKERLGTLTKYFLVTEFDVSSDSFATFRELVMNSPISEEWLTHNYQYVVDTIH